MVGRSILAIHENDKGGSDYLAGDIHGNLQVLQAHLAGLETHDRLVLVGDLLDRGEDNLAVMRTIFQYQQDYPGKLFVVVGNHELFFLNSLHYLEDYVHFIAALQDTQQVPDAVKEYCDVMKTKPVADVVEDEFQCHLKSGGEWLVREFKQELLRGAITFVETPEVSSITYSKDSFLYKIKKYFESLPAAVYCDGKRPYIAVHADMPLNDDSLLHNLQYSIPFTPEQLEYAVNARDVDDMPDRRQPQLPVQKNIRTPFSTIVYAGHTVILFRENASIVRYYSNTVNLDVAAHKTKVALRVNHTRGDCGWVGLKADIDILLECFPRLLLLQEELSNHLQNEMQRYHELEASSDSKETSSSDEVSKGKRARDEVNASPRLFAGEGLKKPHVDQEDDAALSISRNFRQ